MAKIRPASAVISPLPFPLMKRPFENCGEGKARPMRNLSKLSLAVGALALGAAALAPSSFAIAADMLAPPQQMQGQVQPPPAYYPPPVEQGYPPPPVAYAAPPPPPVYYAEVAPPYPVWPGPYYYGPAYGFGGHWAYGPGHWGHWRR